MENCDPGVVEEKLVNVLAHIWNHVNWRRIRGRRYLDVFEHRLEYAKYEPDIPSMLQRLGNSLSIQGLILPVEDVELLRKCEDVALDMLRRWTKLFVLKAYVKAKELRSSGGERK
jgi:hypothetical protein